MSPEMRRLKKKADTLRVQFLNNDVDTAHTFVALARTDFSTGETEHAEELLRKAQRAADQVEKLASKVDGHEAVRLRERLAKLRKTIDNAAR